MQVSGMETGEVKPALRHIANLWTLMQHPSKEREWTLAEKLDAILEAGFDGVCWAPSEELWEGSRSRGLLFLGGMASSCPLEFPSILRELKRYGAYHLNVQLGSGDMLTQEALELTLLLMREATAIDLAPAIESHRGTCTETPEKLYALAEAFVRETGTPLPISWDFSHFAVVKHLTPVNFATRLLLRPDLIQQAQQFHFRPFNGHHAQIPVSDGRGRLTPEFTEWLPFAEAVLRCWLEGNSRSGRDLLICPELGPLEGGYALSTFPSSWQDTKLLRHEIELMWRRLTG
jgi:hypothetical protein